MEGIAAFLGTLSQIILTVIPVVDAYPWIAPFIAFAPAIPGLPRRSIAGTTAGGMLGSAGFLTAYQGASWGLILWLAAWILAAWVSARTSTGEERHA